ncbi:MAG: hypothetical protein WC942_07035 [Clostridia bacterium]|jgi:hypothetical protein
MFSRIKEDYNNVPKTICYSIINGLATLADEEEVCTKPKWAYIFAKNILGANIEKCQEAACAKPHWAYKFARNVPGANIEKCKQACKGTGYAF